MELAGIALRLLVYLQSGLLLGVLLFRSQWTLRLRYMAAALAAVGVILSAIAMLLLAASFSEGGAFFDTPSIWMLLTQTAMGWAAITRAAAHIALISFMLMNAPRVFACIAALIATGTLCWNGHGAMTDGNMGWVHLAANILHLIAGLSWIGAIAVFLWAAIWLEGSMHELSVTLKRFARTGTYLITILLATGIINTFFIIGWSGMPTLDNTIYGRVLLIKICLFAAMLAAAAANRFWLSPRLAASSSFDTLRFTLGAEFILGAGVLVLVSLLGTLDPTQ
jgi:copper resistance protein D